MKNTLLKIVVVIVCCCFGLKAQSQSSGLTLTILSPVNGQQAGVSAPVSVNAINTSGNNIDTVAMAFEIDGLTLSAESFALNLNPNDSAIITFSFQPNVPIGNHNLCIRVDSVNLSPTYDTVCSNFICSTVLNLNYSDNFDGINNGWYPVTLGNPSTNWELGTPNYGVTNSTHSGLNAWDINLNTSYDTNANSVLVMPFFDVMATTNLHLSFWQNRNTELNSDGFRMDYSLNGGPWTILGSVADPLGINWYTTSIIGSSNMAAWDGNSNGWLQSSYDLQQFANSGLIQFRYVFTSDTINNLDGVSIDDFSIYTCSLNATLPSTVSICQGDSVVLCPNPIGGTLPYTYVWSTGEINPCITEFTSGNYSVVIFDANNCSVSSNTILTVNPSPVVSLGPDQFVCNGTSVLLDAGAGFTTYQWNNLVTTQTISVTNGGTYTVTVTNANGCTGSDEITINQSNPIIITPNEIYNCITLTDSVYITTVGGTPPFIYQWSNSTTTFYLTNPAPGVYTVNITDIMGCSSSASILVTGSLNIAITKTDPSCYSFTGTIDANMNGVPPLTYLWNNGATVPQLFNANAGTYTVTVTDINGCSLSKTDSLVEPDPIVLTLDSIIPAGCGASNGSFNYSFTPGAFSIPWVNGVQFGSTTNLDTGIYYIYIIQNVCASNTVAVVIPDSCADVWPGDANYDLVADNKDLLQIGLSYGNTGPVRSAASNAWVAQPATDWSNWFNIGVNEKHADCDGNGIIDAADTIPVLANYGLTHVLKPIFIPQINTLAPDLYLTITNDTTGLSDSVFVSVMCGTTANPIDSIYGLAFRLYYDSALVDTSSISFDINNSFIGTNGVNAISINKNFGAGYADFAITRTDHANSSGHGTVCVMGIVTTDNVAGKMVNPINTVLRFSLGDVVAITANENPLTLDAFGDSIFVDSNLTGINYLNWDAAVKVFPNPANNYFTVASSLTNILKISLLNQFGEVIYKNEKPRLPQHINVSNTTNGIYFLRIETKDGVMYKKMEIIK